MISASSAQDPIPEISKRLEQFASEIEICFQQSDWDEFSLLLTRRQTYLEESLSRTFEAESKSALKQVVANLLVQDRQMVARIQEQKNKLLELNLLCDKGMRAVKAYAQP